MPDAARISASLTPEERETHRVYDDRGKRRATLQNGEGLRQHALAVADREEVLRAYDQRETRKGDS